MRRTTLIALLVAALLALAGCGASGGDESATTTAADGDPAKTTTTADGGGSDGDSGSAGTATVTSEQLEAILPSAEDIGPDYRVKETTSATDPAETTTTSPDEADPSQKAFEEACPKAKELDLLNDEENLDEVTREFTTEDDRGIEVALDPTPDGFDEKTLDAIIEAFNDCGTVTFTDETMGDVSMDLSAKRLEGHGDLGAEVTFVTDFALFEIPVTLEFHGYLFVVDGVGVSVTASGGLDSDTFESVPGDSDLLAPLSDEMEQRVKAL